MATQNTLDKDSLTELSSMELHEFYKFAIEIADACKELILNLWAGGSFGETLKSDKTPVSQVDLQAEALAREMISKKYPSHGIIGEEYPATNPTSKFQWTLDPIDGTQNLINLIPTFGTLIGLRYRNKAIIGVIDHPVLNLRTSGGGGLGVFYNNTKVTLNDLLADGLSSNDIIATNSPAVFGEDQELFSKVISFHPHSRIYYDCYDQTLGVLGRLAVVVEPNLKIWDITPLEALLEELGGKCVRFNERGNGCEVLINAVFGKSKAVDLMCSHLGL
jgi:fructose-1,6-bisphosphatase/inositol monophosphatase family enzyme